MIGIQHKKLVAIIVEYFMRRTNNKIVEKLTGRLAIRIFIFSVKEKMKIPKAIVTINERNYYFNTCKVFVKLTNKRHDDGIGHKRKSFVKPGKSIEVEI